MHAGRAREEADLHVDRLGRFQRGVVFLRWITYPRRLVRQGLAGSILFSMVGRLPFEIVLSQAGTTRATLRRHACFEVNLGYANQRRQESKVHGDQELVQELVQVCLQPVMP